MHSTSGHGEKFSASTYAQTYRFSLAEIKSATRGFHDELIIGQGGFGKVYKGRVSIEETSHVVAIKRLDSMSNQGVAEFRAEIEMLSKLRHCHLVSLIGRLAVDRSLEEDQCSLVRWAKKCVKERKLDQLVDSSAGTIASKCLRRFVQTAYCCLKSDPKKRPTMTEVVASLQALPELQKKFDLSPVSPSIMGFPWKIHDYLFSTTKLQNSDQSSINDQPKSLEMIKNQHEELATRDVKIFTYSELRYATRDFKNERFLGEGSYGITYIGWVDKKTYLPNKHEIGLPVAVNRLHSYVNRLHRYSRVFDLEMLKEFRHPNLVKLIGYCLKGEQLFLVYEFLPNGTFEDLLQYGGVARLPLATKVKMAVGIARGIVFLHETQLHKGLGKADRCVPRFDDDEPFLKRHNILLDEEFTAKLSDYDVTKLVHGCYRPDLDDSHNLAYYFPTYKPLLSNFSGFRLVFTEILIGQRISNAIELEKIEHSFNYDDKKPLADIAKLCFEICDEVNSESKMVTILEKYEKLLQTRAEEMIVGQDT
ncbi:serine/threonine/dual specificity protein kinase, catalytic domain-containing protein [Artemisia annua]|uniref:Serine/threonine/dual specificity protein kinase, catalytic domain-containing protein n=1 Tax=Artemisia annua TaxID=35608 RepID=A0A2U1PAJ0_ARTAN|nr:serine/threonine/dual specificity protein kinase, catalytic domain-containing protein [Artemisia annua]